MTEPRATVRRRRDQVDLVRARELDDLRGGLATENLRVCGDAPPLPLGDEAVEVAHHLSCVRVQSLIDHDVADHPGTRRVHCHCGRIQIEHLDEPDLGGQASGEVCDVG